MHQWFDHGLGNKVLFQEREPMAFRALALFLDLNGSKWRMDRPAVDAFVHRENPGVVALAGIFRIGRNDNYF